MIFGVSVFGYTIVLLDKPALSKFSVRLSWMQVKRILIKSDFQPLLLTYINIVPLF